MKTVLAPWRCVLAALLLLSCSKPAPRDSSIPNAQPASDGKKVADEIGPEGLTIGSPLTDFDNQFVSVKPLQIRCFHASVSETLGKQFLQYSMMPHSVNAGLIGQLPASVVALYQPTIGGAARDAGKRVSSFSLSVLSPESIDSTTIISREFSGSELPFDLFDQGCADWEDSSGVSQKLSSNKLGEMASSYPPATGAFPPHIFDPAIQDVGNALQAGVVDVLASGIVDVGPAKNPAAILFRSGRLVSSVVEYGEYKEADFNLLIRNASRKYDLLNPSDDQVSDYVSERSACLAYSTADGSAVFFRRRTAGFETYAAVYATSRDTGQDRFSIPESCLPTGARRSGGNPRA